MPLARFLLINTLDCFNVINRSCLYVAAPIDSRLLRAFVILARTGSFTRTARELHLSQPAVSHSIKSLEEEMRCRVTHGRRSEEHTSELQSRPHLVCRL